MTLSPNIMSQQHPSLNIDPYHRWLGIPPEEQPPDHYRLLGVSRFESNEDVIRDAAQRQTMFVRTYQLSEHQDLCEHLLGEISRAKACLLGASKESYDEELRGQLFESEQRDRTAEHRRPQVASPAVAQPPPVPPSLDDARHAADADFEEPERQQSKPDVDTAGSSTSPSPAQTVATDVSSERASPSRWWFVLAAVGLATGLLAASLLSRGDGETREAQTPPAPDETNLVVANDDPNTSVRYSSRLDSVERALAESLPDDAVSHKELEQRARALFDELSTPRDSAIAVRAAKLLGNAEKSTKRALRLRGMTDQTESLLDYKQQLERYISEFPNETRARDFETVVANFDWESVSRWNELLAALKPGGRWHSSQLATHEMDALHDAIKSAPPPFENAPGTAVIGRIQSWIREIGARQTDRMGWPESVDFLSGEQIRQLRSAKSVTGDRTYFFYKAERGNNPAKLNVQTIQSDPLLGAEAKTKQISILSRDYVIGAAPLAKLGEQLSRIKRDDPLSQWKLNESIHWNAQQLYVLEHIRLASDVDPIARYRVLSVTQDAVEDRSSYLAARLKKHRSILDSQVVRNDAKWFDPYNRLADKVRPALATELARLPSYYFFGDPGTNRLTYNDLYTLIQDHRKWRSEWFAASEAQPIEWLGLILADKHSNLRLVEAAASTNSEDAYLLVIPTMDSSWRSLGVFHGGQLAAKRSDYGMDFIGAAGTTLPAVLKEGLPVFGIRMQSVNRKSSLFQEASL